MPLSYAGGPIFLPAYDADGNVVPGWRVRIIIDPATGEIEDIVTEETA